ncbi:tetratricopeptide repeat protein, partial [Singulisphaera acidiphila]
MPDQDVEHCPSAALCSLGLAARSEGRNDLAADYFAQAAEAEPGNAEYHGHRAAVEFVLGRLDRALEAFREAARLRPDSAAYQNDLGVVLARCGRQDEAATCYREAIRLRPDFPDAHNNLGNAIRLQGKLDEAVACYNEALRLRPAYPEAHNNLGIALRHQGQTAEAVAAYQEALRLRPAYPEASNNLGIALAAQGRHEAAVAAFQQAIRLRPNDAEAFAHLAAALGDLNRLTDAVAAYGHAIRLRADDARTHKNLGITLAKLGKLDESIASYREALRLRPDYADALNDLGIALARKNLFDEAAGSYRQALTHRPDYAEAFNNLGNTLRNLGQFAEAVASYDRAVAIKPSYADAYNNRGIALAETGQFAEAVDSYTRCIRLRPHHVDAHLNRALTWLREGNFAQGWAGYEWRLRKKGALDRPPIMPAWNGYPPAGLRVLLVAEQGLGDSIHFIRYAPLLQRLGATVIFECPAKLIPLLARTPGIDRIYPQGEEPPEHDVYTPLLTLPGLLGTTLESIPLEIPYVYPDPDLVEHWSRELAASPGFKVGINWQGNPTFAGDYHRSMPLRHFAPLARVPGVRLLSLQKNDGAEQLQELGDEFPVVDLGSRLDEANGPFMDTAAVLKNLDLFITSDTAVAHLAGAMGVPVWVPMGAAPGWQWMLGREDSPWYPSMRLFRQAKLGNWPPVFERIARELAQEVPPAVRARYLEVPISPGELAERIAVLTAEAGPAS